MRIVGRYALYGEIASGGMATVHYGRLVGPVGFSRTVAIKRLHPQFAKDPEFVSMFLDEARLAARIRHPNVVPTLDVVATQGEIFLVMEYVQGESLSRMARTMRERDVRIPPRIVASIMSGVLHGLHAAHEARDERGEALGIVHRDVSPHNVLVGGDGIARVLDFGVAKAAGRTQTTREGQLKGKLSYMAPEQITGEVTRQTDVYAAAIVLWELLTGDRLFSADNQAAVMAKVLGGVVEAPSKIMIEGGFTPDTVTLRGLEALDAVVLRALDRDPSKRFETARDMAIALERCVGLASPNEVGEWVESVANDVLAKRATNIAAIESSSSSGDVARHDTASDEPERRHPDSLTITAPAPSGPKVPEEVASQMSSISVARSGEELAPAPSRRRAAVALAALLVGVVGVVAIVAVGASRDAPSSSGASIASSGAASIAASAALSSTSEPADIDAGAAPSAVASARPSAAPMAAPNKPPRAAPAAPRKPSCDPPYTLDSAGRKHYRAECL